MFGRFLEVSLNTEDIGASVHFYERLGFTQLTTGDTWSHPYGVLSDGRLCIGLHQGRTAAATLSFVRPELAQHLTALQASGFKPRSMRLSDDDFHELQFQDPTGQDIALLEARTFSPPRRDHDASLCGWFSAYSLPTSHIDSVRTFWERAGFIALETPDDPWSQIALTSDTLTLAVHSPRAMAAPVLVFSDPQMAERLERLTARGVEVSSELPRGLDRSNNALIEAPEGSLLLLLNTEN